MVITKAQKFWLESDFVLELLKQTPAYIFWKDKNSVYLGCNNAFARSLGLSSPVEIEGKTDYDLPTTKEESDSFRADDKQVIASKKSKLNIEEYQSLPDGRKVTLLTNKVPLLDKQNNVIGILGIYYDISERKQKEEELRAEKEKAEAANKAKTEFLENVRHDIRTPLTGIVGFSEIIKKEASDPKMKEYAENLSASSYALLDLLNDFLEVIRLNSGDAPLLQKKFDLKKRLSDVIKLNQAKASHKNIGLVFDYDNNISPYLIGDSTRIHRIALELITNALNFTDEGSVKLTAQLAKTTEHGVIVKLIIEDTGIGIAPDQQQEVFLQFKRLTPSYEGKYKGSGLGLSIVKKFLDEIDGEIYVESKVGIGTKFTCLIPLKTPLMDDEFGSEEVTPTTIEKFYNAAPQTKTMELLDSGEMGVFGLANNRVLVVEDNVMAATVAKTIVSSLDCQVDVAPNGKTAVQLAQEHDYVLIFMDIGLPDIDGYEVTKRIRLYELSKGIHVPIIALTAHVDEENKQNCIAVGMNAVLAKPLNEEKAENILNAFIPYRKKPQEAEEETALKEEVNPLTIEGKAIDMATAKKVMGDNEANIHSMLDLLKNSFAEEIEIFQSAYKIEDWQTIQASAHKMKGGCCYCGAVRLEQACSQLGNAIRGNKIELAPDLYKQLLAEIKAAEEAIETKNY